MKTEIKFSFLLLLSSLIFSGCFDFDAKKQQNPAVTKSDFQTIWRLNAIDVEGTRNGENAKRNFTGATFQDSGGNFGYARIEFRENGHFIANLQINSTTTGPVEETVEGESFFSNGAMYINAPGKADWDRLVFKINVEHELFVEIKNYDRTIRGPFDNFYDHESEPRDTVRLSFIEYND